MFKNASIFNIVLPQDVPLIDTLEISAERNGVHELTVCFTDYQPDNIVYLGAAIDAAIKGATS